jgi:hypothetical protein
MDSPIVPADAQHEIQFVLSLMHIANPGKPASPECDALRRLLTVPTLQ